MVLFKRLTAWRQRGDIRQLQKKASVVAMHNKLTGDLFSRV